MFFTSIMSLYDNKINTPLKQALIDFAKKNYPNKSYPDVRKEFKEQYWDKLSKEEQNKLLEDNKKAFEEERQKMEKELFIAYSKSEHSLGEYYDIAEKSYNYVKQVFPENTAEKPIKPTLTSPKERERLKAIQMKALEKAVKVEVDRIIEMESDKSLAFLYDRSHVKSRPAINLIHAYFKDGKDCSNEAFEILAKPLVELPELKENMSKEETEKYNELKGQLEAQKAERRGILDSVLNDTISMAKRLREPVSDEQFVNEFCDDKYHKIFQALAEVQWNNYKEIVEDFGVEPSSNIKNEWQKMQAEMVADGNMVARLGYIANPLYPDIANVDEAYKLLSYVIDDFTDQDVFDAMNEQFGMNEHVQRKVSNYQNLLALRENGEKSGYKFFPKEDLYQAINLGMTKERLFTMCANDKIPAVLSDTFHVNRENLKYADLDGNELNFRDAYYRMHDGKSCKIYDKSDNKYCGVVEAGTFDNLYGGIKEPDIPANYKIDTADPEELVQNMKGLNAELNNATHWYLRSSKEFSNLRKAMNELQKENAFDNREEAKKKMQNVVKLATDYIKLKEDGNAKINDNTKKRLDIARKIANSFERTLNGKESYKDLQNNEPQREQIEVKEADTKASQKVEEKTIEKQPQLEKVEEKAME